MIYQAEKSIESNFVLLCACNEPDVERRGKIIEMASTSDLNWDLVVETSMKHKVFPLLYKNIKLLLLDKLPEHILKKLKTLNFNIATKNFYMLSFLSRILDLFEKNNICAIPFKGPVLSQDAYGDIGLRSYADLDILVSKKKALQSWKLLLENKFQPQLKLKDAQKQKYIKSEDHMTFSKGIIYVELHWEMSGIYLPYPLTYEHVEIRKRKIMINNQVFLNLSLEDLIIYLCVHGTKHGWENIEQICIITQIIKSNQSVNWALIEKLAVERKCKKMLWLGLYLSFFFFRPSIPDLLMNEIKKNDSILGLAQEVITRLFKDSDNVRINNITDRFSLFHIKIRDSYVDKIRYGFRLFFRPTDKEWLYFPVPAYLSFIHYLLRPCRLIFLKLREYYA